MTRRVAVVGAGISGLAAALSVLDSVDDVRVVVFDSERRLGGRIGTSAFAGVEHVDEGADAFLARVPEAVALARRVGLGDDLVSPEAVGAAVWHNGIHPIPDGLLLGVPGRLGPLVGTGLLSWKGKARAAVEPFLPRTSLESDSIGEYVRARFGNEVHERLVDALVGSIYAADTDRFSLAEVPQLASLAAGNRSLLLAARRQRAAQGTATAATSPIFAAPRNGMGSLIDATAAAITAAGGQVANGCTVTSIEPRTDGRWSVLAAADDDATSDPFDAVIFATPARVTGAIVRATAPDASALLARAETADVIMVTVHVPADEWPARLHGMSGYLVPKPDQHLVTAASFGSQKWAHWRPPGGGEILRVSLGRDGQEVLHLDDDAVIAGVLGDLDQHLGVTFSPTEVRITRWPGAFAQYRPHHPAWVAEVERALPSGVFVTGAGFRGIGIPACVRSGTKMAAQTSTHLQNLEESTP
jgi:oxygen-dependent protoporphyrinogen oxidase